ncbi:MAG: hypothetical protein SGI97_10465 [candidate division Zixibacteria bacterium]|nr:hypothetical protein [candidate division Zixibacteria bacterium]
MNLGFDDKVKSYTLQKKTCGGSLGMPSLIKEWVSSRSADEILKTDYDSFLQSQTIRTVTGELIHLKHLVAIQKGLSAMLGYSKSGPDDVCFIDSIASSPDGIEMTALIKIDVMTEEIKGCGGCGSCGSKFVAPVSE